VQNKYGFVYLLAHPDMPDVYKIGFTERSPHQRMEELKASTGVPRPFIMLCYIEVKNPAEIELQMHRYLHEYRISKDREFFKIEDISLLAGLFEIKTKSLAFTIVCMTKFMADKLYGDGFFNNKTLSED
jgi:hypothetical protein